MDGVFVPEKSWPYGKVPDPDFTAILKEEKGFPFWEDLDFEVDLMIANPKEHWQDWFAAGARRVIVHFESIGTSVGDAASDMASGAVGGAVALLKVMKQSLPGSDSLLHTEVGLALNINTPNEKIYPLISELDFVQFMGIAKIGFQGQPFDERVLEKISDLRGKYPNVTISVDGGVGLENAPRLIAAGANRLVVGSAIFESNDVGETLAEFQNLAAS